MLILGIETSCDETAAAIVRDGSETLSNVIATQDELHEEYGGVVPEIASRAHAERMLPVVREALARAGAAYSDLDAIAVGSRPGLIGSLLVGVAAAKSLSWSLGLPLVGVDHVQAHLHAASMGRSEPDYPALGLVVSGGHTLICRMESAIEITRLGSTIDDAIGEAFDKSGTILGLSHPAGPKLDELARSGDDRAHEFPISRLGPGSLDFSFSGLKTAVLYCVRGRPEGRGAESRFTRDYTSLSDDQRADVAASFQRAAIGAVMFKLDRALESPCADCKSIVVGGGVSANSRLRSDLESLANDRSIELRLPEPRLCLDNAAMIAGLGFHLLRTGREDDLSLQAIPTTAC